MSKIAPSILAADTMRMGEAAHRIVDAGCDYVHFDVMDGVFRAQPSFGPALLRDMRDEIDGGAGHHRMPIRSTPMWMPAQSGAHAITVAWMPIILRLRWNASMRWGCVRVLPQARHARRGFPGRVLPQLDLGAGDDR